MEWYELMADGYNRIPEYLEKVLKGLTQEELDWQPRPDCNSIGWLVWHLTRQQDAQVSALLGEEQLWIKEKWHSRFNRPADPKDMGFGDSPEQVKAFQSPDSQTLLEYNRAVVHRTQQYFFNISKEDLDRELNEPWFQPTPTVGVRLVSILDDSVKHAGQAAYLRGLIQGKGWQKY